ncbi:hypothetical protein PsYK624_148750 [Phanerochaete sordida]|uniref:Uncharacterized protein n=1 Tax=Phanerochaete sordida TaxID=48140 RepID=A0A9P3GSG0_9APHY|nr:hypothetical protein PsYK624_148750 [Phanerochaete sordida]
MAERRWGRVYDRNGGLYRSARNNEGRIRRDRQPVQSNASTTTARHQEHKTAYGRRHAASPALPASPSYGGTAQFEPAPLRTVEAAQLQLICAGWRTTKHLPSLPTPMATHMALHAARLRTTSSRTRASTTSMGGENGT